MFFHHNPFMANIFIKSPEKKKKKKIENQFFVVFSVDIKWQHWPEIR